MVNIELVYGAFVDYYGDIEMRLIKNNPGWNVYAARAHSGLNQNRYLFAIVPAEKSPGPTTTLNQLDWISFQTRTSDDNHNVPVHHLYLDDRRKKVMSDKITAVNRTADKTDYVTDSLPISITLIHDPKKKNHLQYPDQAFLYQALDTYQCVVEML